MHFQQVLLSWKHLCQTVVAHLHAWSRVTFALAEKDVPYDSVLIDLRDKPAWYKDIVPTALTPAARINGELVYESMDILQVILFVPI